MGIFGAFVSGGETLQGYSTVYESELDKLHWQDIGLALVPRHSPPMAAIYNGVAASSTYDIQCSVDNCQPINNRHQSHSRLTQFVPMQSQLQLARTQRRNGYQ